MVPLLSLHNLRKTFTLGDSEVHALHDLSVEIHLGEYVAIMGQSGSGKSTLMNIIGCLDTPTSGQYCINGIDVAQYDSQKLAAARKDIFGFVFQRYNLLPTLTAGENVEMPAVYSDISLTSRKQRARELLTRLGLDARIDHRPNQLSGGQQQRVSIARALMNDPLVILADEPTGALDSKSGTEVIALLKELHEEGRTIILITHDENVASNADRIIRIKDGAITEDTGSVVPGDKRPGDTRQSKKKTSRGLTFFRSCKEAWWIALHSLRMHVLRTVITLLGIIIGVSAVVVMLAVGNGSKEKIVQQMSAMGTNLLMVMPGAPGLRGAGDVITLTQSDATELESLENISAVVPERRGRFTSRYGNLDYATTVQGVGASFTSAREWKLKSGAFFTQQDVLSYAPVAVIGETVQKILFPPGVEPLGEYIIIGNVPFQVIGVLSPKGASPFGSDQDDVVMVPLSTGLIRLFGRSYLSTITIKISDLSRIDDTQEQIRQTILARHRTEDFNIRNMASIIATTTETQNTLTLLLASVAAISLLVGGIGVMNIMLVSVTERTREIGIRVATGAEQKDILLQFNIESAVICGIGGVIGIGLGFAIGALLQVAGFTIQFTLLPPIIAFCSAFLTGLFFGYLPARRASQMNPVVALGAE